MGYWVSYKLCTQFPVINANMKKKIQNLLTNIKATNMIHTGKKR